MTINLIKVLRSKNTTNILMLIFLITGLIAIYACEANKDKQPILLADREAPLGWVYLRIYKDSTFEFESRGLERKGALYRGTVNLKNNFLFFNYNDSIPRAGSMAVISKSFITYVNGEYHENLIIKLNKLKLKNIESK